MFMAVGQGEEEREALVGDVVVMAHSARVTSRTVTTAARAQPGHRDTGAAASARTRTPPQGERGRDRSVQRRGLPVGQQVERGVEVVTPSSPRTYPRPIPSCRGARSAHTTAAGERIVNIAPSPFVAAAASCPRTERRTGANATSERADDATDRYEQTASMNTTTQRRNKQARVATVNAPTIAEPPADTPPTPPDIQPCANDGLHRTITGIVTDRPPGGRAVWGESKARAVRALADEQGLDLERSFAYSNGDEDVPFLETVGNSVAVSPERELRAGAQRGG